MTLQTQTMMKNALKVALILPLPLWSPTALATEISNGNFETFNIPETPGAEILNFPFWGEYTGAELEAVKNAAALMSSATVSDAATAEIVATATGGAIRQPVPSQPMAFSVSLAFSMLQPAAAAAVDTRYFAMQLKHGGELFANQVNLRVIKNGQLQAFNGSWQNIGTLTATFTADGGTQGLWDGETPVKNTLRIVADYTGTPGYTIILNGVEVGGLTHFQLAPPSDGLDAISFLGSAAAKNYLVDDVSVRLPPPPGYASWAEINAEAGPPHLDSDKDGLPNGIEYFCGYSGSSFSPAAALQEGEVQWPRNPAASDAMFVVQTSSTMDGEQSWADVPFDDGQLLMLDGSITYRLPPEQPRLFARLKVWFQTPP